MFSATIVWPRERKINNKYRSIVTIILWIYSRIRRVLQTIQTPIPPMVLETSPVDPLGD